MSEPFPKKLRFSEMAGGAEKEENEEKEAVASAAAACKEKMELPPVPLVYPYEGGHSFYVRECYDEYYQLVEKMLLGKNKKCVTVTGTPGIGKSLFYAYFCTRYRVAHPGKCIIASSFVNEKVEEVAIFKGDKNLARPRTRKKMKEAMDAAVEEAATEGEEVLYLCDGPPTGPRAGGQMVVFTSPNETWLRFSRKLDCDFYMPLWTLEELQEAAVVLSLDIEDDEIDRRFEVFGGVARQCLSRDEGYVRRATNELKTLIGKFTSADELGNLLLGKENSVTRHRLLHYEPCHDDKRAMTTKLASPLVEQKLAEKILAMTLQQREYLRVLFRDVPEAASVRGWLFEAEAHAALCQERQLQARFLPVPEATAVSRNTAPQTEVFDIAQTDTIDEITNECLS